MTERHKHADLIHLWCEGTEIECFSPASKMWYTVDYPDWSEFLKYRIKSGLKPDVVEKYIAQCVLGQPSVRLSEHWQRDNLKITFDGETGKLKSAEILV